jgi:hypothetical protein
LQKAFTAIAIKMEIPPKMGKISKILEKYMTAEKRMNA